MKATSPFLRFALVGAVATSTTYAILILLVEGLTVEPVVASAFGYLAGAAINYLLNYYYTFRSIQRHYVAVPRFLLIILVGFCLNTLVMYWAEVTWSFHYVIAQLMAVFVVLVWSFMANRYWTFVQ